MKNIVGVSLKENGKIYFFDASDIKLEKNNAVIVETERGIQYGIVEVLGIDANKTNEKFSKVLRIADKKDIKQYEKNLNDSEQALKKAKELAEKYSLNMRFTEAMFNFDRSQLILYFVSDNRIDFRELVKELASKYKTRIELRQIGVRDKAKNVSGIGVCGRELCCALFLNDLDSVSISMAKNQNLALNPSKINGQCGRLLCCLKYEDEKYTEMKKGLPVAGKKINTSKGEGKVLSVDVLKRSYVVEFENKTREEFNLPLCDGCDNCDERKSSN